MNVIRSNWFCSLLVFAAGVTLCCLYDRENILTIIIYILGVVFTMSGCINIIATQFKRNKGETGTVNAVIGWLAGLGGIGLGGAMLITPKSFAEVLVYVFGALLVLGGLWHIFCLSYFYKKANLPAWLYVPALIILVGGVVVFCSTPVRDNVQVVTLMSGIGAIIFSLETLVEYLCSRHNDAVQRRAESSVAEEEHKDEETSVPEPSNVEIHAMDTDTQKSSTTTSQQD